MKKKVSAAELAKLIKEAEYEAEFLKAQENRESVFNCASTENEEDLRPEYSFSETSEKIHEAEAKVLRYKHALNLYNISTEAGDTGLTIDQVLVRLPQLNNEVRKLRGMAGRMRKQRVAPSFGSSSNIIDYEIANYDLEEVKKAHDKLAKELAKLQMALDEANMSEAIEIDV